MEIVKREISKDVNNNCRADFSNLIDEHSDINSINQWDCGERELTNEYKKPFILYTDLSLTTMGEVLAQVQDGKERAICCASKAFQNLKRTILQQNESF